MAGVSRRPDARLAGLVLNERGLETALLAGVDEVNVVVLVTETFSRRNQGMGVEEAVAMWSRVAAEATRGRGRCVGHLVGGLRLSLRGGRRSQPGPGTRPPGGRRGGLRGRPGRHHRLCGASRGGGPGEGRRRRHRAAGPGPSAQQPQYRVRQRAGRRGSRGGRTRRQYRRDRWLPVRPGGSGQHRHRRPRPPPRPDGHCHRGPARAVARGLALAGRCTWSSLARATGPLGRLPRIGGRRVRRDHRCRSRHRRLRSRRNGCRSPTRRGAPPCRGDGSGHPRSTVTKARGLRVRRSRGSMGGPDRPWRGGHSRQSASTPARSCISPR